MCSQKLFVVTDSLLTNDTLYVIRSISDQANTTMHIISLNHLSGQEKKYEGIADSVLYLYDNEYKINQLKSWLTQYICQTQPLVVLFYNSRICNILASFVAAKLKTGIIVNCIDIEYQSGDFLYSRTAINSSFIAKIKFNSNCSTQIVTILSFITKNHDTVNKNIKRKTIYSDVSIEVSRANNIFESTILYPDKYYPKEELHSQKDIYIDIGYGAKDILGDILDFANKIDARIGTTKKMVDLGFFDEKYLIGQSGKIISSRLCISVGTSGTIQHVVGILHSKKIVAINSDSNAEIFRYCDFGTVCKAEHIIKELNYAVSYFS